MTKETFEKMISIMETPEFDQVMEQANGVEDCLKPFRDQGLEVTAEEFMAMMKAAGAKESDELSEDDLEEVYGGSIGSWLRGKWNQIKREWNEFVGKLEYVFGGQYVIDVAEGKRKPW